MRNWGWFALGAAALAAQAEERGPPPLPTVDPEIKRMIGEISAERIQRSVFVLSSFKTRHTLSDPDPSGEGIGAAAGWVRTQFERAKSGAGGRLTVKMDTFLQKPVFPGVPKATHISNVVATLAGSRAGSARRVYVIGAHYDSRVSDLLDTDSPAPGADDDGSGVAAVLELERVMSRYEFPATIVFIAFAGEEQGLLGSAHWASEARRRGEDIEGMLNDDIIGNSHGGDGLVRRHQVRLFAQGAPASSPSLWDEDTQSLVAAGGENDLAPRQLARAILDAARVYTPDMEVQLIYRADRYRRSGDQASFLAQGYPAVRFTEPWEDYTHEDENVRTVNGVNYGDIVDAVDFVYVADVARVNAAALASLARAPEPPRHPEIETARLTNDSTLRWDPSPEPDVAGYRIVWRDTTVSFWQHHRDVPAGITHVTLPVDKDDVVFAVETFDADGHVSRAVAPRARPTL